MSLHEGQTKTSNGGRTPSLGTLRVCSIVSPQHLTYNSERRVGFLRRVFDRVGQGCAIVFSHVPPPWIAAGERVEHT